MEENMELAIKAYKEMEEVYQRLPANGKPDKENIFTVLAGIVAIIDGKKTTEENTQAEPIIRVLSLATGTKCVSEDMIDAAGMMLHDSHAEVLARRSFIRFLSEAVFHAETIPNFIEHEDCPLELANGDPKYRLKSSWRLCLCISDSPCGDSTIYAGKEGSMTFTGAKLMTNMLKPEEESKEADETANVTKTTSKRKLHETQVLRENGEQQTGLMRLKTGRSDILNRSQSKSCSDKVCRWRALGLQGQALYPYMGKVPLHSVIVAGDPDAESVTVQAEALHRALVSRLDGLSSIDNECFSCFVLPNDSLSGQFTGSKSCVRQRLSGQLLSHPYIPSSSSDACASQQDTKRRKINNENIPQCLPCSFSINWYRNNAAATVTSNLDAAIQNVTKRKKKNLPIISQGSVEVTVAQTGLLQGSTAKASGDPAKRDVFSSRLARRSMHVLHQVVQDHATCNQLLTNEEAVLETAYDLRKQIIRQRYPTFQRSYEEFFRFGIFSKWHSFGEE